MAVLKEERTKMQEEQREKKKAEDKEKAKRREEKERDAIAKAAELEPQCRAHVAAGIDHVLTLKVTDRRNIIRYRFGVIGD
jgi:hypothetical protein